MRRVQENPLNAVLLITDNSELCRRIKSLLHEHPVECCTSSQAVSLIGNLSARVVMVAEDLVKMNGITLFSTLQSLNPGLVGLLIASETGGADPCLSALESGFSGLLFQPFDQKMLQEKVNRAVETVGLRDENIRLRALLPLYGLGEKFLSSTGEHQVLEYLLDVVSAQTDAENLSVMLFDEEEQCLRIAASRGMSEELVRTIRIKPGDKIAGWVYAERKPVILNRETQENSPFAALLKRPEIVSAVSFPMIVRDEVLGVLNVSHKDGDSRFAESDIEMLGILCTQASLALENVRSIAHVEEKTRIKTLLEQYVAPEVADILLVTEADLSSGVGEIKRLTIFFADIRNFTGMVQLLSLDVLHQFLNEFFELFTETIFQFQGTVDKFMGDAVLALFGAPVTLENANLRAVETALAIRQGFAELKDRWQKRDPFFATIDVGMGITCGEMFLGNVGSKQRLDYTVIGTEVNMAQRLAARSSSCGVYLTHEVAEDLAGSTIRLEDMGGLALKGVQEPVQTFSAH